jgi:hypothetical protein
VQGNNFDVCLKISVEICPIILFAAIFHRNLVCITFGLDGCRLRSEAPIEPWIEVMFFAAVAESTESLQIADIVAAAAGQGNDVIDR